MSVIVSDNVISKAKLCDAFSPFYGGVLYSVQRTLCHCEERSDVAISRKGNL